MSTFLSVIIPVFNESKRIKKLTKILKFLQKQNYASEIIIVNDGSGDDTLDQLKYLNLKFPKKIRYQVISYKTNRGKGYAVKKGMLTAKGKFRLFTDIDLSTPLESFNKFERHLKNNDVIIGSRKTNGSKVTRHQPIIRENLGKIFTNLSRLILNVSVSDFTCGFKCFSDEAANKIFRKQRIDRWGFDSEILFLARKYNFKMKEIPVAWKNDPLTKVKFPDAIIKSLSDLIEIRRNEFNGKY